MSSDFRMSPEVVGPVGHPLYGVTVPLLVTEDLRQSQTGDSDQDQGPQVEMKFEIQCSFVKLLYVAVS